MILNSGIEIPIIFSNFPHVCQPLNPNIFMALSFDVAFLLSVLLCDSICDSFSGENARQKQTSS